MSTFDLSNPKPFYWEGDHLVEDSRPTDRSGGVCRIISFQNDESGATIDFNRTWDVTWTDRNPVLTAYLRVVTGHDDPSAAPTYILNEEETKMLSEAYESVEKTAQEAVEAARADKHYESVEAAEEAVAATEAQQTKAEEAFGVVAHEILKARGQQ